MRAIALLLILAAGAAENTLAAFDACLSLQFGMEFDVDRTRDGVLVASTAQEGVIRVWDPGA